MKGLIIYTIHKYKYKFILIVSYQAHLRRKSLIKLFTSICKRCIEDKTCHVNLLDYNFLIIFLYLSFKFKLD